MIRIWRGTVLATYVRVVRILFCKEYFHTENNTSNQYINVCSNWVYVQAYVTKLHLQPRQSTVIIRQKAVVKWERRFTRPPPTGRQSRKRFFFQGKRKNPAIRLGRPREALLRPPPPRTCSMHVCKQGHSPRAICIPKPIKKVVGLVTASEMIRHRDPVRASVIQGGWVVDTFQIRWRWGLERRRIFFVYRYQKRRHVWQSIQGLVIFKFFEHRSREWTGVWCRFCNIKGVEGPPSFLRRFFL